MRHRLIAIATILILFSACVPEQARFAETPQGVNVGSHIHVIIDNHPADGFPVSGSYTFKVTVKAHNTKGIINKFFVQDEANTKIVVPLSLGPCADCSVTFTYTVNFGGWSTGRHELRWHANIADEDPVLAGAQQQFTTSRSQVCVVSCLPNHSNRPTPYNGSGSWYSGHDYSNIVMLSPETNVKPGGSVTFQTFLNANYACVFLNPDFHNMSSGTVLGCWTGKNAKKTIIIPATALVGDRLVAYGTDGFEAALFRIFIGDGTPQPFRSFEYQSWWSLTGIIIP